MFIYKKLATPNDNHLEHCLPTRHDPVQKANDTHADCNFSVKSQKRSAESAFGKDRNPPLREFLEHLNEVRLQHNAVAVLLEKGIKNVDQDGNKLTAAKLTQAHIDKLRFSIITQRRSDYLYKMRHLLLGDQFHSFYPLMEYSFSKHVLSIVPTEIENAMAKPLPEQYDHLYAITKGLMENEYWFLEYDDVKAIQKLLTSLARSWKKLLAFTDKELEIDGEFTRPGCIAMLNRFSKSIQGAPDTLTFKWEL